MKLLQVVIDIETNSLDNPTKIWVIVCKDLQTGVHHIFRRVSDDQEEAERFAEYARGVSLWIGHNILGYDCIHIHKLLNITIPVHLVFDTLIASKFTEYSRDGHSIEDYGLSYGLPKGKFSDWSHYSQEMEDYCVRDTDIAEQCYRDLSARYGDLFRSEAFRSEQAFQEVVNDLQNNGFGFDLNRAMVLRRKVEEELAKLDEKIHEQFPSKLKLIREINPKLTQHGTFNRSDFRWIKDGDLSEYNGGPFCRCNWAKFNPSSHKQIIEVLHAANWSPTERTQTYIIKQRENRLDIGDDGRYSWKINETNLLTLPPNAPASAKSLARRILLESRRRTLTEWISLCKPDGRIHGEFFPIGAWTHRMAHQKPNTANIPNSHDTQGRLRLYGAEMRALWCAPKNRLLVGVDAESIQLRIFAHYINDPEFTEALVKGRKDDKTDPHSLNQKILGPTCKSRAAAKRFIYALLLGAGIKKLAEVLDCEQDEARNCLGNLLQHYTGFARLKKTIIPRDARRGWFEGLDGRRIAIPGTSNSERAHLAMSGYLQGGEVVVMKHATLKWYNWLHDPEYWRREFWRWHRDYGNYPELWKIVNFVHDEWQTEVPNDIEIAKFIAKTQCKSLEEVGVELGLKCPLAGSYWNEDLKDYTIGTNWKVTH